MSGFFGGGGGGAANAVVNDADNTLAEGVDIAVGTVTGTKFGTDPAQKLAFYGDTPIVQPSLIAAPVGGGTIDAQARTAIGGILTALANLGLTA
jgi:hypothetical protein